MKRSCFFVIALIITVSSFALGADGTLPGNGTKANPFLIEDYVDFKAFANSSSYWASGIYSKLMCDVDLDPGLTGRKTYTAAVIGRDTSTNSGFQGTAFSGIFDGNGHIVSNLTITTTILYSDYLGLFGQINFSGEISNLGLENVNITGGGNSRYLGGLVGANFGTIENCYATGSISGNHRLGGLCGRNNEGVISRCYANVSVTGQNGSVDLGGLCGLNINYGIIEDCYATGSVIGGDGSGFLGGLCGANIEQSYLDNSYAAGAVTGGEGSSSLGGLCGDNYFGIIIDCYSLGPVSGGNNSSSIGGLCGYAELGGIFGCYAAGLVVGEGISDDVGGLCGRDESSSTFNCFWDVETSGMTDGIGSQNPDPEGITGKTTAQMQMQSTFLEAGWEFADFQVGLRGWYLPENCYPQFDWQNPAAGAVPDISAVSLTEAQMKLTEAAFAIGNISHVNSWKTPANTVAGISVHPGGYVAKSVPVDLFISIGSNGDGSPENPYEIASRTDLEAINTSLSSCYTMTADIFLGYDVYYIDALIATPYGSSTYDFPGTPFSGIFDGNGHIISNLNVYSSYTYNGLFGYIDHNGVVKNLGIKNSCIDSSAFACGSLCGGNAGNISNCYIMESTVAGFYGSSGVGGLCGINREGNISNCYFSGAVTGTSYSDALGGLCGVNMQGTISDCYSTGAVTGEYSPTSIGGLCGVNRSGSFNNCFWDMETSGMTEGVGNEIPDPNDVAGKTTTQMQMISTFTSAGWDFVGEEANGHEDHWRMCIDGVNYPKLWHEYAAGDFACGDGVDMNDFSTLAETWALSSGQSGYNDRCDLIDNDTIDIADLLSFSDEWLTALE